MRVEIHMIQNHSPGNLNRDDLGAPKTCWFGGVPRLRISSQCLKRSIRMSPYFQPLRRGIRTRRLAELISPNHADQVRAILELCGFKARSTRKGQDEGSQPESRMLIFTTQDAVEELRRLVEQSASDLDNDRARENLAREFARIIAAHSTSPDMALCGRMLEPSADGTAREIWADLQTTVEAALQVAHAISTHQVQLEVDYYVAADDLPGPDAGAGYVDEAQFASACFYKYFSICWETLTHNLREFQSNAGAVAAHTVGAFLKAAALTTPSGKQNSFAAHNPPDGILVELRHFPINYANAFARPVEVGQRDLIEQSIAQLYQYVHDMDLGFDPPLRRFWFSPGLRFRLEPESSSAHSANREARSSSARLENFDNLERLIEAVVDALGFDWSEVRRLRLSPLEA